MAGVAFGNGFPDVQSRMFNLNFIELKFNFIELNLNFIELNLNFIELKLNYGIEYCDNRLARGQHFFLSDLRPTGK